MPLLRNTARVYRILGKFVNLSKDDRHDVHNSVFVILLKRGLQKFRGATVHELRAYLKGSIRAGTPMPPGTASGRPRDFLDANKWSFLRGNLGDAGRTHGYGRVKVQ